MESAGVNRAAAAAKNPEGEGRMESTPKISLASTELWLMGILIVTFVSKKVAFLPNQYHCAVREMRSDVRHTIGEGNRVDFT